MKAARDALPFTIGRLFELKILFQGNSFSIEMDGQIQFENLPLSPFSLEEITGVLLAGQWGEVAIHEVGYLAGQDMSMVGYLPPGIKVQMPMAVHMMPMVPQTAYMQAQHQLSSSVGIYEQQEDIQSLPQIQQDHHFIPPRQDQLPMNSQFEPIPQLQPDPNLQNAPQLHPQLHPINAPNNDS
eukprot:TRINITY_DN7843_c0_g1_i3.p1 TRINITY_DN7843_c0_g1~~TRINITY_DN7843_c0_g1_i3.p1  ORF type:complete len:183 (+),score=42.50 TRINITY_DN7843_c0_g1_i3:327-875(+)